MYTFFSIEWKNSVISWGQDLLARSCKSRKAPISFVKCVRPSANISAASFNRKNYRE